MSASQHGAEELKRLKIPQIGSDATQNTSMDTGGSSLRRLKSDQPIAHLSRRYRLSASHRLHAPTLTEEQNRDTYGKCNNPYGHGHNYFVEITVAGPVDPETGFVVDLPKLDALAKRELLDRFDGTHLNADGTFAGSFVPSTENLSIEVERVFRVGVPRLDPAGRLRLHSIRIEETNNNSFDLPAQTPPDGAAHAASDRVELRQN